MKQRRPHLLLLVGVTLMCALLLYKTHVFVVWSQILALADADPVALLEAHHAHALRFALMYPVLELAWVVDQPVDNVFTLVVIVMLIGMAWLNAGSASLLVNRDTTLARYNYLVALVALCLLATTMNGRLVFALLGASLILHEQTRMLCGFRQRTLPSFALQLVGVGLMSVSSGTFVVGVALVALFALNQLASAGRLPGKALASITTLGGLAAVIAPWLVVFVEKNLDFHDGSFETMLEHGFGAAVAGPKLIVLVAGAVIFLPFVLYAMLRVIPRLHRGGDPAAPVWSAVLVSLGLGALGYSTLLAALTPALMLLGLRLAWNILQTQPGAGQRRGSVTSRS